MYEMIKENDPNIVFVHYKQVSQLQKLLSKHHCPLVTKEVRENVGSNLMPVSVVLEGPANVYCDNDAVTKNTLMPESTMKKKHHSIAYHRCREAVAAGTVRVAKQGTRKNLADLFTKVLTAARRQFLFRKVHILAIDLNVIVLSLAEGFPMRPL